MNFKPGDKVKCVNTYMSTLLKENEIYIILKCDETTDGVFLSGLRRWFGYWRFVKVDA